MEQIEMLKRKRHLKMIEMTTTGKTKRFQVVSLYDGEVLGIIKWNNGWRQYWFEPTQEFQTGWSWDCLLECGFFIKDLMGISVMLSGYVAFTYIFISAYLNGGSITVDINSIGEMNLEFLLMAILFLPVVYSILKKFVWGD